MKSRKSAWTRVVIIFLALILVSILIVQLLEMWKKAALETPQATKESRRDEDIIEDNYIAMMNYISLVNDEIDSSKKNKLLLEQVYKSLMDNTAPHAIDDRTQVQFNNMLNEINNLRMIDVKRDRLNYIYQQNQAQSMRAVVPNPISFLAGTTSIQFGALASAIAYMAIDSTTSYKSATSTTDLKYLQDGWELDDEETNSLNQSREDLFNYMIDMVQKNHIPDQYVLDSETVEEYVKYKEEKNNTRRIEYLESKKDTFLKFGDYWLTLADSYYQNGDYSNCIDAIDSYINLNVDIFRKDHGLAKVLPLAISATQESVHNKAKQRKSIESYLSLLKSNLETDDWALRYFAAQTDEYLYSMTQNKGYLQDAYSLAKENVNYLIDKQLSLNKQYLKRVQKKKIPKDASKEQKKEIKEYNKLLVEKRKTELPPVYEPLYLNCDLMFALLKKLNLPLEESKKLETILHGNDSKSTLFLTAPLENMYDADDSKTIDDSGIAFDDKKLIIPAYLVSERAKVVVMIGEKSDKVNISDWVVSEVDRSKKKKSKISDITIRYESKNFSDYAFEKNMPVQVVITPVNGSSCPDISVKFRTKMKKFLWIPSPVFERVT